MLTSRRSFLPKSNRTSSRALRRDRSPERGARQTLVYLVLRKLTQITVHYRTIGHFCDSLGCKLHNRNGSCQTHGLSCIQQPNPETALFCAFVPLPVALNQRMQAAFHRRVHKIRALRGLRSQEMPQMRQPWLKSDTFASKFFWNIGELLGLRCSPASAANRPDRVASLQGDTAGSRHEGPERLPDSRLLKKREVQRRVPSSKG